MSYRSYAVVTCFVVERLGGHVQAIGPGDRASVGVHLNAREVVGCAITFAVYEKLQV